MKKSGDTDGKRIRRLLALHQLLRSGREYAAEQLLRAYEEKTQEEVTLKTIQNDLRFLREELNAPLPEKANKHHGYYYREPYSLLEALDNSSYSSLNEAVALLRQVVKKTDFVGLEDILLRLEQRISVTEADKNAFIVFEETDLKGKEYLPTLVRHVGRDFLRIRYKPFAEEERRLRIFPLLLKEYNNRWFLIAWEEETVDKGPRNFALDRIEGTIQKTAVSFSINSTYDWQERFRDLIGVTLEGALEAVVLRFSESRFRYVQTKKLHRSQEEIGERTIRLTVYTNRELRAKIMEFGPDVEVLAPESLREQIGALLRAAATQYPAEE